MSRPGEILWKKDFTVDYHGPRGEMGRVGAMARRPATDRRDRLNLQRWAAIRTPRSSPSTRGRARSSGGAAVRHRTRLRSAGHPSTRAVPASCSPGTTGDHLARSGDRRGPLGTSLGNSRRAWPCTRRTAGSVLFLSSYYQGALAPRARRREARPHSAVEEPAARARPSPTPCNTFAHDAGRHRRLRSTASTRTASSAA